MDAARELFHRQRAVTDEMAAMIGRGRIHLLRAHYELARDAYRPVLALIEKTGDPWLERIVTNHVAVIDMCLGNYQQAMLSVQRSLELCRRYGDRAREGDGLSVAGIILLEVGLHDGAASMFAEALEILSRTASRWSRADCLIYAGLCDLRRGHASGLALLDEAVDESRRLGARYLEANALVARAGAKLRLGDLAGARQDAADGTEVAHGATLVSYEILGLARHALARARHGDRSGEAVTLVERALGLLEGQRYLEAPRRRSCLPRPRCSPQQATPIARADPRARPGIGTAQARRAHGAELESGLCGHSGARGFAALTVIHRRPPAGIVAAAAVCERGLRRSPPPRHAARRSRAGTRARARAKPNRATHRPRAVMPAHRIRDRVR